MIFSDIFSNFLCQENFNINCKPMIEEIIKHKKNNKTIIKSNYGGWQSDSFLQVNKPFDKLFNLIDKCVNEVQQKLQYEKKIKLHNYWFNVNSYGSFNRPHSHTGGFLSGVFYLSVPKNSGNIVFINPVGAGLDFTFRGVNIFNQYNSGTYHSYPKNKLCLLFSSHLYHYVETNMNKKERISLSFNYGL